MILREYQAEGVAQIRDAFRTHKAVLYQLPTGGGKTVMFTFIANGAAAKGNRTWILVHRRELIAQASRALDEQRVAHGIVSAGFSPEDLPPVQVCSVQTLVKRHAKLAPPDLIVIDEAHHAPAGSWRAILDAYPSARILGVTATPLRLDGKGLGEKNGGHFQTLISGPSVASLIAAGYLASPVIYTPQTVDAASVKTLMGDFARAGIVDIVDKPTITGCAIEHYQRICPRASAIAFCASIAHAEHVTEQFRDAGVPWGLLVGAPHITDAQRRDAVRNLQSRIWRGVSTVDLVSEGFDVPCVETAILLRHTQSLGLYLQQVGRALRPYPGKTRAVILDHVGNVERHGVPQEEREWSLDDGAVSKAKADSGPTYRLCPACFAYHLAAPACPQCGHVYLVQSRTVKQVAGELTELTPEQIERQRVARERRREEGRAQSLEQLAALGEARGYKAGWAQHRWEARQRRMQ